MPEQIEYQDAASRVATLHAILEPIAKGVLAVVAICYAIGLLIKNIYLAEWSAFSGKLLEVEYVLSGALFILFLLLSLAFWAAIAGLRRQIWMTQQRKAYRSQRKARITAYAETFAVTAGGAVVLELALAFFCRTPAQSLDAVVIVVIVLALPAGVVFMWRPMADIWRDFVLKKPVIGGRSLIVFVGGVVFWIAISVYVNFIYPRISPVYGGGRRVMAELRTTDEGAKILEDVGFSPERSHARIFKVEVIFEDDSCVTVVAPGGRHGRVAANVRRDQISMIVTSDLF